MLFIGSNIVVQDNFGIRKVKCIRVPKKGYAYLGSLILVSVLKKDSNKKRIKLGQLFKALVINTSNINFRKTGQWTKGFNSVIILKKSDNIPISKRIKGPVCFECRKFKMSKILSMGSYIF